MRGSCWNKVCIEAPQGWGARQMLTTAMERLGYHVEMMGAGDTWWLLLS